MQYRDHMQRKSDFRNHEATNPSPHVHAAKERSASTSSARHSRSLRLVGRKQAGAA